MQFSSQGRWQLCLLSSRSKSIRRLAPMPQKHPPKSAWPRRQHLAGRHASVVLPLLRQWCNRRARRQPWHRAQWWWPRQCCCSRRSCSQITATFSTTASPLASLCAPFNCFFSTCNSLSLSDSRERERALVLTDLRMPLSFQLRSPQRHYALSPMIAFPPAAISGSAGLPWDSLCPFAICKIVANSN